MTYGLKSAPRQFRCQGCQHVKDFYDAFAVRGLLLCKVCLGKWMWENECYTHYDFQRAANQSLLAQPKRVD